MDNLLCDEEWLMSTDTELDDADNDSTSYSFSMKQDCVQGFRIFLDKEARYMPKQGYMELVQTTDLIRNARFKAINWLIKSQRRMNLTPGTVFIAANYLDRFIALRTDQCQGWQAWMFDLLSIACLSVATKFNETISPTLHEFQEEGLDHCFAPSLIQRMELTLMKELGWNMDCSTSFSYVHSLIQNFDVSKKTLVEDLTSRVTQLLLTALLDPEFLEFRPYAVSISAVKYVMEDLFPLSNNDLLANLDALIPQDHKDDLIKCQRTMEKLLVQDKPDTMLSCGDSWPGGPSSPVTVLKVECFDLYEDVNNMDLSSSTRKRKREEAECGIRELRK